MAVLMTLIRTFMPAALAALRFLFLLLLLLLLLLSPCHSEHYKLLRILFFKMRRSWRTRTRALARFPPSYGGAGLQNAENPKKISFSAISRQWSKLVGNILGSKATTEQKLSRNQYDENEVYTG